VEEVISNPPPPASRRYIAKFFCVNDNVVPVYVPIGDDNKITSSGSFDASQQPVLFMPGTTRFEVPFDGSTLKWTIKTFDTNKKTATTTTASSSSGRCSNLTTVALRAGSNRVADDGESELVQQSDINIYPNPIKNTAVVSLAGEEISPKETVLFDAYGKKQQMRIVRTISRNAFELDLSGLPRGFYLLRVKGANGYKNIRIIKG
jgi:hypothetical protein